MIRCASDLRLRKTGGKYGPTIGKRGLVAWQLRWLRLLRGGLLQASASLEWR